MAYQCSDIANHNIVDTDENCEFPLMSTDLSTCEHQILCGNNTAVHLLAMAT